MFSSPSEKQFRSWDLLVESITKREQKENCPRHLVFILRPMQIYSTRESSTGENYGEETKRA